ncbi:hypothetical protein COCOBI_10-5030 [Coccomyxa sp. Obi]|nr:hypothetical protein COCOBI_10-5030 [Coccomyxa sp. Obi]
MDDDGQHFQGNDGPISPLHPDSRPSFGEAAVAADSGRAQEWVEVDGDDALGADTSAGWNKGVEMQAWWQQKLHKGLGSAARLQSALAVAVKSWPLPDLVVGSVSDASLAASLRPQKHSNRASAEGHDSDAAWPAQTRIRSASFSGAAGQDMTGSGLANCARRGEAAVAAADPDSWMLLGSDPVFRQPTFEEVPSPLPSIDEEAVLNYLDGIMDEASSDLDTISLSSSADHWMEQAEQQVVQANCSPSGTWLHMPNSGAVSSDTPDEALSLAANNYRYTSVDSAQQLQEASPGCYLEASKRRRQTQEELQTRATGQPHGCRDTPNSQGFQEGAGCIPSLSLPNSKSRLQQWILGYCQSRK